MPHRGVQKGFGKGRSALVRLTSARSLWDTDMFNKKHLIDFGSAALVVLCGALAGHFVQAGMGPVQWAGASCAVLGSVTLAVFVRVWPPETKAQRQED